MYNIADQTSQLTLRYQKLYKAATKYFIESNPFSYFLPPSYSTKIINLIKNNKFEKDSLVSINNYLLNVYSNIKTNYSIDIRSILYSSLWVL